MEYSVGKKLHQIRSIHGFSLRELGRRADVDATYLGRLEKNKAIPSIAIIQRISEALEIPIQEFLEGKDLSTDSIVSILPDEVKDLLNTENIKLMVELKKEVLDKGITLKDLRQLVQLLKLTAVLPKS